MSSDQSHPSGPPIIRVLAGAGAAAVALALVWAQFRGLDVLDAATHFLVYQFPADNPDRHTRFELFARPLWLLCGGNVVAFRLLTLALVSAAAWIFWRSWRSWFGLAGECSRAGLALWLSAMGGLAWLPVVLGYNALSTFFALLAWSALSVLFSPRSPAQRLGGTILFLAAVVAAYLVKPPAALALALGGAFLLFALLPLPRWVRLTVLGVAGLTLLSGLGLALRWLAAVDVTEAHSFGGVVFSPAWIAATLQRYSTELAAFLPALGRDLSGIAVPALVLGGLAAAQGRPAAWSARWKVAAYGFFFGALVVVIAVRGLWDGSFARAVSGEMARCYLLLWISLLPAWAVAWFRSPGDCTRPGTVAIAFFFLPLTCGFGSTNTLYFSALHWTVFWTAGLLIVAGCVARALGTPSFRTAVTGLLIAVGAAHLWSGHFLRPYMNQPALWRQDVPVAVGHPATTLKLDASTARFLGDVRGTLERHGYRPGDDVFGFFNLPGVIFVIGARQPGAPWYFGTWYHGDDTDGGKIRAVDLERRQRAWIITQADVTHFRREFLNCGIDFPDAYQKIGQTVNPTTGLEIGIWKPKKRP